MQISCAERGRNQLTRARVYMNARKYTDDCLFPPQSIRLSASNSRSFAGMKPQKRIRPLIYTHIFSQAETTRNTNPLFIYLYTIPENNPAGPSGYLQPPNQICLDSRYGRHGTFTRAVNLADLPVLAPSSQPSHFYSSSLEDVNGRQSHYKAVVRGPSTESRSVAPNLAG